MDFPKTKQQLQLLIKSQLQTQTQTLTLTLDEAIRTTFTDLKSSLSTPSPSSSFFFSFNGKKVNEASSIFSYTGRKSISTFTLNYKLIGGGGDGGATGAESRDCYLNMYAEKKPDKVDPNETRLSKWTTCALSFEPLTPPCVVDRLGNIFNKEPLVKSLLSKSLPKEFRHIKGLKDMISIHLTPIPLGDSDGETRFHCPVSGLQFNGKYNFFALLKCGHVVSAKALKEVKSSGCLVCHTEFAEFDKVVINGSDDEVCVLRERMEADKVASLRLSKKKKGKNGGGDVEDDCSVRLSGKRHGLLLEEKARVSIKDVNEVHVNAGKPPSNKKFKAVAPPNADKKVYGSIFTSSRKTEFKETYSCRSLPLGRN